jgi:Na+-driven multidrug efflux pump
MWTTAYCILCTVLIFLIAAPILSLFSDAAQIFTITVPTLRANTILFFTFGFQFTYSTLYLSMGKALAGGFLNICRQGILFMPIILFLPSVLGVNGVMYAQAVADLLTTVATIFFAVSIHKKLRIMEQVRNRSSFKTVAEAYKLKTINF